jgi:hypothetical protein
LHKPSNILKYYAMAWGAKATAFFPRMVWQAGNPAFNGLGSFDISGSDRRAPISIVFSASFFAVRASAAATSHWLQRGK